MTINLTQRVLAHTNLTPKEFAAKHLKPSIGVMQQVYQHNRRIGGMQITYVLALKKTGIDWETLGEWLEQHYKELNKIKNSGKDFGEES